MSKALYRKYRPTKLQDVIGQSSVTDILAKSLKTKKISHAYLFIGPRGTGKTSIARIFAHAVNDFDYQLEDSYIDIVEIDAASNTGVDNIRDLREKAVIAPTKGKYKVYIIDEVHMLSKSAFNALLKTLEEPPEHVIFIMATTDAERIPATITSRSQIYTFRLAEQAEMVKHLRSVADAEKITIEDAALEIITERGGGSFRDSLSLLDQISTLASEQITAADVIKALGLPPDQTLNELLNSYQAGDLLQISTQLKNLLAIGTKPEIIASNLLNYIVKHPQPQLLPLLAQLATVTSPFAEAKLLLALCSNLPTASQSQQPVPAATPNLPTKSTADEQSAAHKQGTASDKSVTKSLANTTAPTPPTNSSALTWEDFLNSLKTTEVGLHAIVSNAGHQISDNTLKIYPTNKMIYKKLSRSETLQKLSAHTKGFRISIEEPGSQNNSKYGQISDIMGGIQEVKSGEIPF